MSRRRAEARGEDGERRQAGSGLRRRRGGEGLGLDRGGTIRVAVVVVEARMGGPSDK